MPQLYLALDQPYAVPPPLLKLLLNENIILIHFYSRFLLARIAFSSVPANQVPVDLAGFHSGAKKVIMDSLPAVCPSRASCNRDPSRSVNPRDLGSPCGLADPGFPFNSVHSLIRMSRAPFYLSYHLLHIVYLPSPSASPCSFHAQITRSKTLDSCPGIRTYIPGPSLGILYRLWSRRPGTCIISHCLTSRTVALFLRACLFFISYLFIPLLPP